MGSLGIDIKNNEFFLKKPERIEALELIMVPALMIWRLIERTMRLNR
jgi:hypothetical protein